MEHEQKAEDEQEREEKDREVSRLLLTIMEGYSDKVIPPLSELLPPDEGTTAIEEDGMSSRKRRLSMEAKGGHVENLHKAKDKREKMTESYAVLRSMVPNVLPKATREKTVSETIAYIRYLKKEIRRLEELKNSSKSKEAKGKISTYTNQNSSISVTFSGNVAFFGIESTNRHNLVAEIFRVFQKHGAQVLAANISVNHGQLRLAVTAALHGNKDTVIESIKRDISAL